MSTDELVLAIDQGTSSTRAIAYDLELRVVARVDRPLRMLTPQPGWAEQSPADILESVVDAVAEVLNLIPRGARVVATGLANQGETVVAWDSVTGLPLANAVSWQCRRSESVLARLRADGHEASVRESTGLPLDPYFSAGKMTWLLEHEAAVADAASAGTLLLGTVDAWLTHRLGASAITDPSTASRTQLLGLRSLEWEPTMLDLFGVPAEALPRIVPTAGELGTLHHPRWPIALPLTAASCDQQAALVGNAGLVAGAVKATYGTGVFVVANAGHEPPLARTLEVSVGWQLADGTLSYVLQGGVLSAAALLNWLHVGLGLAIEAADVGRLAATVPDGGGVVVLPALGGLGAPWYQPDARAVIAGLTAATRPAHLARAVLDAIAHRVCDIVEALVELTGERPTALRVDGGLSAAAPLIQRQADLLGLPVLVAADAEATARGIAQLAACGAGLLDPVRITASPVERDVAPRLDSAERAAERERWRAFVARATTL